MKVRKIDLANALLNAKPLKDVNNQFIFSVVTNVERRDGTFYVTGLLAPGYQANGIEGIRVVEVID